MDFTELGADCQLTDITVKIGEEEFPLHHLVMSMKSDDFKDRAKTTEVIPMDDFPGGKEAFAIIVDFCYNRTIEVTEKNVAELRCGAECLKMRGESNLITITEERFDDMLDVARRMRSTAIPFEVLHHCMNFGEIADQARLVDRCIDTICGIWSCSNFRCDVPWNKVATLPYSWFTRFLRGCTSRSKNPLILAEMVYRYTFQVMSPNLHPKPTKKPGSANEEGNALDPKEVVEDVLASIPFRTPMTEVITPEWVNRLLDLVDNESKYRQKCIQLCCGVLRGNSAKAFRVLGPEKIKALLKGHKTLTEIENRKLVAFVDHYVKDAAEMKLLNMEQYLELLKSVPRGCVLNSEIHLITFENLVDAGHAPTEEQRADFLKIVDITKCCDKHMKRIMQKEVLPPEEICKAVFQTTNDCVNGDMIGCFCPPDPSCPHFRDEKEKQSRKLPPCDYEPKTRLTGGGYSSMDRMSNIPSSNPPYQSDRSYSAIKNRKIRVSSPVHDFHYTITSPLLDSDRLKSSVPCTSNWKSTPNYSSSRYYTCDAPSISSRPAGMGSYKKFPPFKSNYTPSCPMAQEEQKCNQVNSCQCQRNTGCCSRYGCL